MIFLLCMLKFELFFCPIVDLKVIVWTILNLHYQLQQNIVKLYGFLLKKNPIRILFRGSQYINIWYNKVYFVVSYIWNLHTSNKISLEKISLSGAVVPEKIYKHLFLIF